MKEGDESKGFCSINHFKTTKLLLFLFTTLRVANIFKTQPDTRKELTR